MCSPGPGVTGDSLNGWLGGPEVRLLSRRAKLKLQQSCSWGSSLYTTLSMSRWNLASEEGVTVLYVRTVLSRRTTIYKTFQSGSCFLRYILRRFVTCPDFHDISCEWGQVEISVNFYYSIWAATPA